MESSDRSESSDRKKCLITSDFFFELSKLWLDVVHNFPLEANPTEEKNTFLRKFAHKYKAHEFFLINSKLFIILIGLLSFEGTNLYVFFTEGN